MHRNFRKYGFLLIALLLTFAAPKLSADEIADLKNKIEDTDGKITEIEAEIDKYEKELSETRSERNTLENKVREIDLTRRKLASEISVSQSKLNNLTLNIDKLDIEIREQGEKIEINREGIAQSLRQINIENDKTFVEMVLSEDSLAAIWDRAYTTEQIQSGINATIVDLREQRALLRNSKNELETNKLAVVDAKEELADRKAIADENRRQEAKVLGATKSREAEYKQLLEEKIAAKERFEAELKDFEAQLQIKIDPSSLPTTGKGTLSWPVASPRVTQYFGNTAFAKSNPQVYSGKGHNGIDMGMSVGTKILSAASGTVVATGNTDTGCPGGSYGKWTLIKHNNGLSTLYAHLSLHKASKGESVERGQLIGYSGNTGYSTGPHLHFTVYASEGVRVDKLKRKNGTVSKCPAMPLSPLEGYLNPLLYLPEL